MEIGAATHDLGPTFEFPYRSEVQAWEYSQQRSKTKNGNAADNGVAALVTRSSCASVLPPWLGGIAHALRWQKREWVTDRSCSRRQSRREWQWRLTRRNGSLGVEDVADVALGAVGGVQARGTLNPLTIGMLALVIGAYLWRRERKPA